MRYSELDETDLIRDAFHCYRRNNLTISQAAFSRRILGQSPSYYSSMIARNRRPSRAVLDNLLSVTKTILAALMGSPNFGKPQARALNKACEELEQLICRVASQRDILTVAETQGAEGRDR